MPRHSNWTAARTILVALVALALVAFGVSLGAAGANADPTYSVGGTITDASGTGINGLGIALYDSSGGEVAGVSSNADGTYSFSALPPDTYTLTTASGNGYRATSSVVPVTTGDVVFNLTDPRFTTISGVATVGGAPAVGIAVSASVNGQSASDTTDGSGGFSFTLPATSGSYAFRFTNGAGTRLAIDSYSLGTGTITLGAACALGPNSAGQATLTAGGSVTLSVVLDPDQTACSPAAAPSATPHHHSTLLAQTGSTVAATPSPTASTTTTDSSQSSVSTMTAPAEQKPVLTPTVNSASMPGWAWLLIILAVLAILGGVGFTVVRHR